MNIYKSITELIGNTPLVELVRYNQQANVNAKILAKLEYFNPAGSAKDRVALAMIEDAEKKSILKKDSVIIEPTSGNTGIGLASIATVKGYRTILTMPDTMSIERRTLLASYGAEIVLTDGKKGMAGAIEKAIELAEKLPNSFIPGQFTNPENPKAHYQTTGPEIWKDTDGKIDIFVAGVGTGGTITGTGKFLKTKNKNVQIVAVEPKSSPMLTQGKSGPHKIQGIGANFIPEILDLSVVDNIITISDEDALSCCKAVAKSDGVFVGISSGAVLACATQLAKKIENKGKTIVAFFPDGGNRYLSVFAK